MKCFRSSVLILILLSASCSRDDQRVDEANVVPAPQATIFIAKQIISMEQDRSVSTAVAVAGDKIIALGNLESIKAELAGYELKLDQQFADKVILPGLIENHLHPTLAGILLPTEFITPFDWHLPGREIVGVQGRENYLKRLVEVESSLSDPAQFLISWGYHQYFHGELTRADLDKISSTRPMIVWQRSFHELIANSAALERLGIKRSEFASHTMINFDEGHFWERGMVAIFPKLAPIILAPERLKSGMLDGFVHAQMNGITTMADQGSPMLSLDLEIPAVNQVLKDNSLPLRMLMVGSAKTLAENGFADSLKRIERLPELDTELVQFLPKQVKLFADGAFYSQLMQMEDGYLDGHHGEWLMPPEQLMHAAQIFWHSGYQLHIHVNGDKGVKLVLDVIEQLQQEYIRPNHQTVLHHYGYSNPDQAERVAALGVSVSANPFYLWALGDKYAEIGLGPERAHYITRLGDLERNGVPISFHSDLPMAPASPLTLAGIAASRISAKGNVLGASEKVSIDTAIAGITIEAATAIQQQDRIGSIEVGKLADFTILEQNPFDVAPENFKDIAVIGTVLGGEFYSRPEQ